MVKKSNVEATIKIGEDLVTIRRKGISSTVVARILGRNVSADSTTEVITLDRLVHRQGEDCIGNADGLWSIQGAFVSVLSREVAKA